jgi:hypothetical protein
MTDYLNSNFDWTNPEVVSAFDEHSLWSFYAATMLLDRLPMISKLLGVGRQRRRLSSGHSPRPPRP